MPEKLLFCADNLFDVLQYPLHVITADQEATNYEAWHVADWRRQYGDAWRATSANADHYVKVACDQLRGADFLAIDRESNHVDRLTTPPTGKRFLLEHSADDFATPAVSVFDANPVAAVPGGGIASAAGALSDEGSWLKTFTADGAYYWKLTSKAMGANIVPSLTLVTLGKAWQPSNFLLFLPTSDRTFRISQQETESPYGWVGRTRTVKKRVGRLLIKPADESDFDFIMWQVVGLFGRGFPAWIIHDKVDGSRDAIYARCPNAELDFGERDDWITRGITIPFEEEQPTL